MQDPHEEEKVPPKDEELHKATPPNRQHEPKSEVASRSEVRASKDPSEAQVMETAANRQGSEEEEEKTGAGPLSPPELDTPLQEEAEVGEARLNTIEETLQTKAGFPIIVTKNDESRNTEHIEVLRADSFDNSMSMRDHPLLNESIDKTDDLEQSKEEEEEKATKPRPRRKADKLHAPEPEQKKVEHQEAGRRARRPPAEAAPEAPPPDSLEQHK